MYIEGTYLHERGEWLNVRELSHDSTAAFVFPCFALNVVHFADDLSERYIHIMVVFCRTLCEWARPIFGWNNAISQHEKLVYINFGWLLHGPKFNDRAKTTITHQYYPYTSPLTLPTSVQSLTWCVPSKSKSCTSPILMWGRTWFSSIRGGQNV